MNNRILFAMTSCAFVLISGNSLFGVTYTFEPGQSIREYFLREAMRARRPKDSTTSTTNQTKTAVRNIDKIREKNKLKKYNQYNLWQEIPIVALTNGTNYASFCSQEIKSKYRILSRGNELNSIAHDLLDAKGLRIERAWGKGFEKIEYDMNMWPTHDITMPYFETNNLFSSSHVTERVFPGLYRHVHTNDNGIVYSSLSFTNDTVHVSSIPIHMNKYTSSIARKCGYLKGYLIRIFDASDQEIGFVFVSIPPRKNN